MSDNPPVSPTIRLDSATQQEFARLSGDRNPIHMDAFMARRPLVGRPVVHGMHAVLWALEHLAESGILRQPGVQIVASFRKPIYVGDELKLEIRTSSELGCVVQLTVDGLVVTTVNLNVLPAMVERPTRRTNAVIPAPEWPQDPVELSIDQMTGQQGVVAFANQEGVSQKYPALAAILGSRRTSGLATMSRLVGMVCPGLHSMLANIDLTASHSLIESDSVTFEVCSTDKRLRRITQDVEGAGWIGHITCFVRQEPVSQPALSTISPLLSPGEFRGTRALILGGSRGLGEVTAKLIASGGGDVAITYLTGHANALRVQKQIEGASQSCRVIRYDAGSPPIPQLAGIQFAPTSLYYFATPPIFFRKTRLFSSEVFEQFCSVYIDGFYQACMAAAEMTVGILSVFYPSTIALEERPAGVTEYAMAKAAGELLCADLVRFSKGRLRMVVSRLPRVLTDQTVSIAPVSTADPVTTMLPIVREVEKPSLA